MKKFRIGINNPMSEQYFYYEMESEYGDNPIEERGQLAATGHVTWWVSKNEDMSNKFRLVVSPSKCSYITIEELEE